jgi:vitamin B12 transporter
VESRASRDGGGIDYSIVPAIRWDHFSDFDGRVSPRVGLVASTGNPIRFSVKANGGMSYRAPAFNDLYWPRDLFTVGNPSLLPEHSRDADLGLLVRTSSGVRFNAGATLFVKDVHDYILWQADDDGLWSPANVGSAAIHGIEGEIGCEPAPGILFMNWSYTRLNAVDRSASALENGKQLAYQPKDQLTAILHCTINRLDLQAEWRYTSRRFIDAANTKSLDAFHTTDVTARYTFPVSGMSFSAMIAVRNIEGVAYQTNDGYPVPGRELRCTIGIEE